MLDLIQTEHLVRPPLVVVAVVVSVTQVTVVDTPLDLQLVEGLTGERLPHTTHGGA